MPKRSTKSDARTPRRRLQPLRVLRRWALRGVLGAVAILTLWILAYVVINPPTTPYMAAESRRLGGIDHEWVPMSGIAPVMARAAVAAEDADYCLHWGFDMGAIRAALEEGANRGASTISQQTVKNVFLWQGRSWPRKALEALITPAVEAVWSKRRILEVYLNVAEFGEGVFGIDAAAHDAFGVTPDQLTAAQAAALAAVLPNPKERSAAQPSGFLRERAASIRSGAATIAADGRDDCFES
ncbi:monofunctional biosynthetic peptidoglycan transglycosylase [Tranquillimonas rosea]|uniref:Biosynthetic peptidoglycan transglycosylase n=1 Tax=Tranquillimonas rosea TaxID=641238 RepID=A0A1H9UK43_9RHOB|nr:monofunctional biosynthetic peptidoglycan transglycosylase [Tranquillimonas rosea]SES09815.1 monofunctional biosynthetic peptidoglycan transglycosylase [Tranquillimonas rosea]